MAQHESMSVLQALVTPTLDFGGSGSESLTIVRRPSSIAYPVAVGRVPACSHFVSQVGLSGTVATEAAEQQVFAGLLPVEQMGQLAAQLGFGLDQAEWGCDVRRQRRRTQSRSPETVAKDKEEQGDGHQQLHEQPPDGWCAETSMGM